MISLIYYLLIIFFLLILFLIIIKFRFNNKNLIKEKIISFECGFNSFENPRVSFSIQFFKILLVFLFFDIEIVVVLPLIYFKYLNIFQLLEVLIIIIVLIYGLYVELKEGSLD